MDTKKVTIKWTNKNGDSGELADVPERDAQTLINAGKKMFPNNEYEIEKEDGKK